MIDQTKKEVFDEDDLNVATAHYAVQSHRVRKTIQSIIDIYNTVVGEISEEDREILNQGDNALDRVDECLTKLGIPFQRYEDQPQTNSYYTF